MSAIANADDQPSCADERAPSPERRLDAIADILARGLARVILAEDAGARSDDARPTQEVGNTAERALIDAPSGALMDERGEKDRAPGGTE